MTTGRGPYTQMSTWVAIFDGQFQWNDRQKVTIIAHPEHSSDELKHVISLSSAELAKREVKV